MPPDDKNITTILPKQSNLSPVKHLNLAISFQEKQRQIEENVQLFLSAQSTKFGLWEILQVKQPRSYKR